MVAERGEIMEVESSGHATADVYHGLQPVTLFSSELLPTG